jgi:hypothetical protein
MAALHEVIEREGLFCTLYSDRASHFFVTAKAGEPVDNAPGLFPASAGTRRTELRHLAQPPAAGVAAGRHHHARWGQSIPARTLPCRRQSHAFRRCGRSDLDWMFWIQTERVVGKDDTVGIHDQWWQLDKSRWPHMLAGQMVTIHQHLDGRISIRYGPHVGAWKRGAGENQVSLRSLEIASGDSHFPTRDDD